MIAANYKTKRKLKASIGKTLEYQETSLFGLEFKPNGKFPVVGPSPTKREWYAEITMIDGKISKVE